jgi:hypothetical protein
MRVLKSTLLVGMILTTQVTASDIGYAGTSIGGQIGIFGVGANLKGKFFDNFGVSVGFDDFTYNDIEIVDNEVTYNFDVKTQDFLATLDWHPYASSFKASAGVVINNSNLDGTVRPTNETTFIFNGVTYSTSDIAKVDVTSEFDPIAPYIGFGWDTSWEKDSGFGFTFDVGLIYQGSATVDYSVAYKEIPKTGNAAVDAAASDARDDLIREVNANLDIEKKSLQAELDDYEFLPYIAIGVNYKF